MYLRKFPEDLSKEEKVLWMGFCGEKSYTHQIMQISNENHHVFPSKAATREADDA